MSLPENKINALFNKLEFKFLDMSSKYMSKKNWNSRTIWADTMKEEIEFLQKFITFKDMGKLSFLGSHTTIVVHSVFAVWYTLHNKALLVANGHLTDTTTNGTYSSVVSLCIAIVAAEINNPEIIVDNVSFTCLEAYTQEKVWFPASPEFGHLEGHCLVIVHTLYGLCISWICWHSWLADILHSMNM
jgi:hypothetical protein